MTPRRSLPEWARSRSRPRDRDTGFLKPRHCGLYVPGHTVHWIQAIHSHGEPHELGRLVEIDDNVLTIELGGTYRQLRNHEPERLVEIIGLGKNVSLCPSFAILRHNQGGYCFSVAPVERPWRECVTSHPDPSDPDALARAMNDDGGFTIPGREALGWTSRP